jgi:hypothetical protein
MRVEAANKTDIEYVARRMRPADYAEFSAVYGIRDRDALVDKLVDTWSKVSSPILASMPDEPIAVGGVFIGRQGVGTLYMAATERLPVIGLPLTRFIRHRLLPQVRSAGVHRIDCLSISTHLDSHRWLESLGLVREAELRGFGCFGEDFVSFSWVSHDVRKVGDRG